MSGAPEDDALRRLWETDMEYRMAEIETAESKAAMYASIAAAYDSGWNEEEIALHCKVPVGRVRAAIEQRKQGH